MTRANDRRRPLALLVVLASSCFSISAPGPDASAHVWRGVMGRIGAQGSFRLTSTATGAIREIVGSVAPDATIAVGLPLTANTALGQWNTSTGELTLAPTLGLGALTATASGGYVFGQYTGFGTGPGGIAGFEVGPLDALDVYCGTSTITGSASPQYFAFAVFKGQVAGIAEASGVLRRMLGAVQSGAVTANGVTGEPVNINSPDLSPGLVATGALNATMAGGTLDAGGGVSGTWIATVCRSP